MEPCPMSDLNRSWRGGGLLPSGLQWDAGGVGLPPVLRTGMEGILAIEAAPMQCFGSVSGYGAALNLSPGSGSAFQMRIRIQLLIKLAPKAKIIHII